MTGPDTPEPARGLRRPSRLPIVLAVVVVVLLLGGGAFLAWSWLQGRAPAPSGGPPAAAPAAAPAPVEAEPAAVPPVDPRTVSAELEPVSADPLLRRCLAEGDAVRRWAFVADNLALGTSPRKELACLAPAEPFSVERRGDRWVVAAASYARYDAVAGVIGAIDTSALAGAYRRLHAPLQAAYRLLGYPQGSLDRAMAAALGRLERFVPPEGDVEVVEGKGAIWTLADPALESAGSVEKHLLRMGPRNARKVAAKAREVREALALPPPGER